MAKKEKYYTDCDGSELIVIIYSDRIYYYNSNGKFHRLDGPAVEYADGVYCWWKNGLIHRVGGPARYFLNTFYWFINNKIVNIYYICG